MADQTVKPITEEVVTGMPQITPKGQIVPNAEDRKTSRITANPLEEYVAAQGRNWSANYLRSLSFAVDDITADFGDDLYERMMLDSQVSACVHFFKMAVLSDPVQMIPAVDAFKEDEKGQRVPNKDYKQAREIADFVQRCIDRLADLHGTLYDLLDGAPFGNRVAELIFEIAKDGDDIGKTVLAQIKPKPRRSLAFVVDVFMNFAGMLGLIPGQFAPALLQTVIDSPENIPNLLPRGKFAVLTFRPKNKDPRGQSMLRAAYDAWFVKQQVKQERLKFLAQLAGGSVVGYTAPDAQQMQAVNSDGTLQYDSNDAPVYVNPEQAMLVALLQWMNGTAAAFPNGSKVDVNYPHPDSPFDEALDRQDREICTAILGTTRMVMESEHGSKADSETAQDVFGLLVRHGKQAVQSMLQTDVVRMLVTMNYPPEALRLCPKASLSKTEHQDFPENAKAVGDLYSKGYLVPSQLKDTDSMLGLTVRTEEAASAPPVAGVPSPHPGGVPDVGTRRGTDGQSATGDDKAPENGKNGAKPDGSEGRAKELAGDKPATFLEEPRSVLDRLIAAFSGGIRWITYKGRSFPIGGGHETGKVAGSLTDYLSSPGSEKPPRKSFNAAAAEILDIVNGTRSNRDRRAPLGGASFSLYFGDVSGERYHAVSPYPDKGISEWFPGARPSHVMLRDYIKTHSKLLSDPRSVVGVWYDKDADETFLDVAILEGSRLKAREIGHQYRQRGIFDLFKAKFLANRSKRGKLGKPVPGALPPHRRVPDTD